VTADGTYTMLRIGGYSVCHQKVTLLFVTPLFVIRQPCQNQRRARLFTSALARRCVEAVTFTSA
jgi:hypothetical protein